ncbi:hypothetical protein QWA68_009192 [Fusarium oxysporum]|nr:hypothetical protein QWA68_009192 [Fusarium oxysporum]
MSPIGWMDIKDSLSGGSHEDSFPPGNLSEESDYYDYEAFADNFDDEPLYWPEPGVKEEEDERHICL